MPAIVLSDSLPLAHHVMGAGPPALVIAGGPARHPSYLQDLAGLTQDLHLVVPELRGVGDTPQPVDSSRATWWAQAEDMAELASTLDTPVTVIAHSAGCRIAVALASGHPGLVEQLVLITPPPMLEIDTDIEAIIAERDDEAFREALRTLEHPPDLHDATAHHAWQHAVAPAFYARWDDTTSAHSRIGQWNPEAAAQFFAPGPVDLREALQNLPAPTLILAGEKDPTLTPSAARSLAAVLPRAEVVVIDESGHYPWVEQPSAFRSAVTGFLTEQRAGHVLCELL
ncbi:alpha/beta hydrolase [Arachnia propionica]|uniref:Alpha/beta hydrolase n=1 Tax=Arachnia propionica TaxID=1750 RepID=A0A3P1TDJ9_9ACTN|nr:alpha/beta hydrolase [Arachnia propionica]RRD06966.1 alpha/beta hydrolase [Arachnia propionica]